MQAPPTRLAAADLALAHTDAAPSALARLLLIALCALPCRLEAPHQQARAAQDLGQPRERLRWVGSTIGRQSSTYKFYPSSMCSAQQDTRKTKGRVQAGKGSAGAQQVRTEGRRARANQGRQAGRQAGITHLLHKSAELPAHRTLAGRLQPWHRRRYLLLHPPRLAAALPLQLCQLLGSRLLVVGLRDMAGSGRASGGEAVGQARPSTAASSQGCITCRDQGG